jgi:hypothetical protein
VTTSGQIVPRAGKGSLKAPSRAMTSRRKSGRISPSRPTERAMLSW